MITSPVEVDVLCVGHASYDLIYSVDKHPGTDEKIFANDLLGCGGGPAANAAVAVSRLGKSAAFAGYLGQDLFGETHYQELLAENIDTHLIVRGTSPTPLSTILVKPDGNRALINYKGSTRPLAIEAINFSSISPKVVLLDGHEPEISLAVLAEFKDRKITSLLDAGSVHPGTLALLDKIDYLVASEKFACQYADTVDKALDQLANKAAFVVITLGEKGLIWKRGDQNGSLPALPINAIDTTGAGDAFHGAFAVALTCDMTWLEILQYASAAGSFCCTKIGARQGLPNKIEHRSLYNGH